MNEKEGKREYQTLNCEGKMVFLRSFMQQPRPKTCAMNSDRIDDLELFTLSRLEEINASVQGIKTQMQEQHDLLSGMMGETMKILLEMKEKA